MSRPPIGPAADGSKTVSDRKRGVKNKVKEVKQEAPSTSRKRKRVSSKADGKGEGVSRHEAKNKPGNASNAAKRNIDFSSFRQNMLYEEKKQHPHQYFDILDFQKKCVARWHALNNYDPPKQDDKGRGKKFKQKRMKDPNAPKRPLSDFFWFCYDERPKIRRAHPGFSVGDVGKELWRRWKVVDEKTWEKYNRLARGDKARYREEMEAYRARGGGAATMIDRRVRR